MSPKIIDMHSHWSTKAGYALQSDKELELQSETWRSKPLFRDEPAMVDDLRQANVRAILDFGFTKFLSTEQQRVKHDYAFATQRQFPDTIIGNWFHFQPEIGKPALAEFRRCLDEGSGFVGLAVSGGAGVPASDPASDPFYKLCIEANVPALICIGHTGLYAGLRGGGGIVLDNCHPRHLDITAGRFPDLNILAARPAWPWQAEAISILLHKANVWYELHGWSPQYFGDDLKHEIPRRLKDRVMFGADYPLLGYERLVSDWQNLGYSAEILEKVFFGNAEQFLAMVRR
jgi:predicted TIM-barrel fold metal-dependent hydrolase